MKWCRRHLWLSFWIVLMVVLFLLGQPYLAGGVSVIMFWVWGLQKSFSYWTHKKEFDAWIEQTGTKRKRGWGQFDEWRWKRND